jgi:hypothetical protein
MVAQANQAPLAPQRRGKWARGLSIRSAKTYSMIVCARWVRSAFTVEKVVSVTKAW